jgi:predicted metal-dependent hydrolase
MRLVFDQVNNFGATKNGFRVRTTRPIDSDKVVEDFSKGREKIIQEYLDSFEKEKELIKRRSQLLKQLKEEFKTDFLPDFLERNPEYFI